MEISSTVLDQLRADVGAFQSIKSLEHRIIAAQKEGMEWDELEASEAEMASYRAALDFSAALDVVRPKLDQAEKKNLDMDSLEYSSDELGKLRAGMLALSRAEPDQFPAVDKGGLELHEVEFADDDVQALRYMLGLFNGAKRFAAGLAKLIRGEAA